MKFRINEAKENMQCKPLTTNYGGRRRRIRNDLSLPRVVQWQEASDRMEGHKESEDASRMNMDDGRMLKKFQKNNRSEQNRKTVV